MKKLLFLIIVGVGAIFAATSVPAATFTYPLDFQFSDTGTDPEGPTPWLTATFEDIDPQEGTDLPQVRLTMSALNLTDDEFVSEWYFNIDPEFNITNSFEFPPTYEDGPPITGFVRGPNSYKANGNSGDGFDIVFSFETANNSDDRFTSGETSVFIFVGNGEPLTAESFNFLNEPGPSSGPGMFYTAAHVQGIGEDDNESGWIAATESISAIPEPGSILLLGAGLASLFGIRRFRFKRN